MRRDKCLFTSRELFKQRIHRIEFLRNSRSSGLFIEIYDSADEGVDGPRKEANHQCQ